MYEILWARLFAVSFGQTIYVAAAVIAAVLAGMALGSGAGNWLVGKSRRRLLWYALIELATATAGWFSFPVLGFAGGSMLRHGWSPPPASGWMIWLGLSFILLIVPSMLMGLAVPFLVASWKSRGRPEDKALAWLHSGNALGASGGALSAGLLLIPIFGVSGPFKLAACFNATAAIIAVALDFFRPGDCAQETSGTLRMPSFGRNSSRGLVVLLVAFFIGLAALMAQTAWIRGLSVVLGSSAQIMAFALCAHLLAHALGAALFLPLSKNSRAGWRGFGAVAWLSAAALLAAMAAFPRIPYFLLKAYPALHGSPLLDGLFRMGVCLLWIGPPAWLSGMMLPWLVSLWTREESSPSFKSGLLLSADAAGSVIGALLSGLFLIPVLGSEAALSAAFAVFLALGAAAFFVLETDGGGRKYSAAGLAVLALCGLLRPQWDPAVISSGVFQLAHTYERSADYASFKSKAGEDSVLYHAEGAYAAVTARRHAQGYRYLQIDGKVDASDGPDASVQALLAYFPLLLHPEPKRALVIGLGSGGTAAALAQEPALNLLEIVEIEPRVVEAAGVFEDFRNIQKDPRARVLVADAGYFLSASTKTYDLIVSEPSNLWTVGSASLYAQEHYRDVISRLAPDGIFCQWLHGYSISVEEFRTVLATYGSVFKFRLLLRGPTNNYFLIGSKKPLRLDYRVLKSRIKELAALHPRLGPFALEDPAALLGAVYVLNSPEWERRAAQAPVHRLVRPRLAPLPPWSRKRGEDERLYEWLESGHRSILPPMAGLPGDFKTPVDQLKRAGKAAYLLGDARRAYRLFTLAGRLAPKDGEAVVYLLRTVAALGSEEAAERALRGLISADPGYAPAYFHLADLLADRGDDGQARQWLERGLKADPTDGRAYLSLGTLLLDQGDVPAARRVFKKGLGMARMDARTKELLSQRLRATGE